MNEAKSELVIIRRRSAFDEPPVKGGVWKIAYADFMTAMMAFFLVMWLINALNQDQRKIVASYFNPIKLAEDSPTPKGLRDPTKKEPAAFEGQEGKRQRAGPIDEQRGDSPTAEKPPFYEEKVLFREPYAILAEIAADSGQAGGKRRVGALATVEEEGLKGGEAYRDPFDPGYWRLVPEIAPVPGRVVAPEPKPHVQDSSPVSGRDQLLPIDVGKSEEAGKPTQVATNAAIAAGQSPVAPTRQEAATTPTNDARPDAVPSLEAGAAREQERRNEAPSQASARQLQTAISEALADTKAGAGPVAEVRQVEEGLLVSLTDDANFGMFAVGSAEPRPELVRAIDKIGPLLAKRPGTVVIRGHTDNRPYRSENYDNWRLSTARAQMAYYMLVRSGVDPQRIEHVEGYADRRPKLPSDPAAAQNRRIEILIREKRP